MGEDNTVVDSKVEGKAVDNIVEDNKVVGNKVGIEAYKTNLDKEPSHSLSTKLLLIL